MLKQRILTALVALTVLGLALFVVPPVVARIVIVALMLAAAWEWAGLLRRPSNAIRMSYVVFIALLIGGLALVLPDDYLRESILKLSLAWWSCALLWLFLYPTEIPDLLVWICGALAIVPAWLAIDALYMFSPEVLIFALLIVWAADIGAYFAGKRFGRVKLAPEISPGKTWEGVLGGLCAVLLIAGFGSRLMQADFLVLVPFCLAIGMLSVVGDLTVSMFKRNAGVKDSGKLFPGHGGVLDRIDGVMAGLPLFALALSRIGVT